MLSSVIVCHLLVRVPHPLINVGFGPNTCTPSEGRDEELALSACTNLSWWQSTKQNESECMRLRMWLALLCDVLAQPTCLREHFLLLMPKVPRPRTVWSGLQPYVLPVWQLMITHS